jgi:hypothetical protein
VTAAAAAGGGVDRGDRRLTTASSATQASRPSSRRARKLHTTARISSGNSSSPSGSGAAAGGASSSATVGVGAAGGTPPASPSPTTCAAGRTITCNELYHWAAQARHTRVRRAAGGERARAERQPPNATRERQAHVDERLLRHGLRLVQVLPHLFSLGRARGGGGRERRLGANRYGAAGRRALVRSLPLLVSDTLVLIGFI